LFAPTSSSPRPARESPPSRRSRSRAWRSSSCSTSGALGLACLRIRCRRDRRPSGAVRL